MENLFKAFMEAEGDLLQDFDPEASDDDQIASDDGSTESAPSEQSASPMDDLLTPPPGEGDELSMDDSGTEEGRGEEGEDGEQKEEESISKKVSNNLNSELLNKFTEKNEFVDKTIESLRKLIPLLPAEVVQKVNDQIKTLNAAAEKGKEYVINKFIDKEYGENLIYFEKLNILYELLLKNINTDIKTIQNN